ncbi:MAG: hypothetical protein LBH19_11245 [Dysgonamonadaceae bacterium]|nr:hypothetical protein [Dysgonamonadaceae bacterium]
MKQIFLALGLPETATSNQAVAAIEVMKAKADKVDAIQLSAIEAAVDGAIGTGRVTADKRNHFISLGKTAGIASLNETLSLFHTPTKPSGIINQGNKPETAALKWGDLSPEQAEKMKAENAVEYARLYREEFGVELGV